MSRDMMHSFYTPIKGLGDIELFHIDKFPVLDHTGEQIPDVFSLRNTNSNAHLGMVSSRYRPIQLDEMLSVLDGAFKANDVVPNGWTMAWNGRKVIIRSELNSNALDFDDAQDPYETYLYTVIDNTGKGTNKFIPSTIRAACTNVMHAVIRQGMKFMLYHSSSFDEKVALTAANVHNTLTQFRLFGNSVKRLRNVQYSLDQMQRFAAGLIPGKTLRVERKQATLVDLFKNGRGAEGKTKYDALCAVTEYDTHFRTKRPSTVIGHIRGLDGYTSMTRKAYQLLNN